ncbi:hypothetical protein QQ056_07865 [Oscillatoria laete-virens NRMC-F 0139]|nr:hypothetical protein [Oscillatoria laete-virens]MDL5053457.1 hypothetical protein [Oscillatoria laete-virens NRMC-F 0139]
MASYREWNQVLASYFTSGVPRGTKVYLSIDDDLLERIGQNLPQPPRADSWSEDFQAAVREEVVFDGQITLSNLQERDADSFPRSVAFLCATVLAAYQMAETEEISERNYFKRLQEVLGLSGVGRPPGMKSGDVAEEPLWKEWNRWLMEQGFMPSAKRGRGGSKIYINYPISQTLLRCADKDRLQLLFNQKQWTAQWDAMTLFAHVRCEAQGLPQHLKELLSDNRQRYEAVAEVIHEVYEQWFDEGKPVELKAGTRPGSRHLFAGLYRTEDPFFGQVDYYLYPRQLRGRQLDSVQVKLEDNLYQLRAERPGWYLPLELPIDSSQLDGGVKYQIAIPDDLDSLILPARDFWILILDPDNPDSGVYASWGQPTLGTQFVLLCKGELLDDLNRLRDERLLEWSGEPLPVWEHSNWVELHQCQVISQAWDGVFVKNQALKDALQPSMRLSISFSSGLRVPQVSAWLEGHSPQVTVFGFSPTVELQVTRLSDNHKVLEKPQSTNTPIAINFPTPGEYLVEAKCADESSEQFIRIVDWSCLSIEKLERREVIPIASIHQICGTIIEPISELILNKVNV